MYVNWPALCCFANLVWLWLLSKYANIHSIRDTFKLIRLSGIVYFQNTSYRVEFLFMKNATRTYSVWIQWGSKEQVDGSSRSGMLEETLFSRLDTALSTSVWYQFIYGILATSRSSLSLLAIVQLCCDMFKAYELNIEAARPYFSTLNYGG